MVGLRPGRGRAERSPDIAPATGIGGEIAVVSSPGGVAEFTFQVDTTCSLDPIVNIVDVTSGAESISAFVATQMVPGTDDDDGDGVNGCSDVCPATVIPESVPTRRLLPFRFALTDADTTFDSAGYWQPFVFTTEDTSGCSCEQIIDELGLGIGHEKCGCSLGAMIYWSLHNN